MGTFGAWNNLIADFDPDAIRSSLKEEGGKAFKRIGSRAVAMAVKLITSGKEYVPNSEITIAFKKTSTPLVGGGKGGDLARAITSLVTDGGLTLWFGINRTARSKDGKTPMVNIGAALHDGAVIDLTKHPKVRQAVFARLRKVAMGEEPGDQQRAQAILERMKVAAKAGTGTHAQVWIIPARPFLLRVLESKPFRAMARQELSDAGMRSVARRAAHAGGAA